MSTAKNLLNVLDKIVKNEDVIEEATPKKTIVVRDGKKQIKFKCPPGFKFNAEKKSCDKMSSTEIKGRQKAARKAAISGKSKRKQAAKKAQRSKAKR